MEVFVALEKLDGVRLGVNPSYQVVVERNLPARCQRISLSVVTEVGTDFCYRDSPQWTEKFGIDVDFVDEIQHNHDHKYGQKRHSHILLTLQEHLHD